jgi:hypothetical protein
MLNKISLILLFSITYASGFSQNLYDSKSIKEIRLTFPRSDWSSFMDSVKKAGKEARLKGKMVLDGQTYTDVGVRYKGNSSYFGSIKKGISKLPLNIKLDKKQKIEGKYESLKLSNVNRDASFIREALSYEIVRTYMFAPQCNYAKVYVNDKFLGLYNNVEAISEKFLKNHYETSTPKGGEIASKSPNPKDEDMWLIKCDPEWTAEEPKNCPKSDKASLMYLGEDSTCYKPFYELDKEGNWKEFIHFVKILNQEPDKIERSLNVDQTLWMLALNNIMVNLDSYSGLFCHNYYLLRGSDGRFTPLIWDLNMSFGGFAFDGLNAAPLSTEQLQTLSPMLHNENAKRPLISQLLKIPMYQKIYIAHMKTILNDWFVNDKYLQRAKELAQLIEPTVEADKNKHYTFQDFKNNMTQSTGTGVDKVIGIEELMKKRTDFLKNHPLLQKVAPKIEGVPTPSVIGEKQSVKIKATGATRVWLLIRNGLNQPYRYLPMSDDGTHNDDAANDGTWGVVFEKKSATMQYYILAENEDAVETFPSRAGLDYLEIK